MSSMETGPTHLPFDKALLDGWVEALSSFVKKRAIPTEATTYAFSDVTDSTLSLNSSRDTFGYASRFLVDDSVSKTLMRSSCEWLWKNISARCRPVSDLFHLWQFVCWVLVVPSVFQQSRTFRQSYDSKLPKGRSFKGWTWTHWFLEQELPQLCVFIREHRFDNVRSTVSGGKGISQTLDDIASDFSTIRSSTETIRMASSSASLTVKASSVLFAAAPERIVKSLASSSSNEQFVYASRMFGLFSSNPVVPYLLIRNALDLKLPPITKDWCIFVAMFHALSLDSAHNTLRTALFDSKAVLRWMSSMLLDAKPNLAEGKTHAYVDSLVIALMNDGIVNGYNQPHKDKQGTATEDPLERKDNTDTKQLIAKMTRDALSQVSIPFILKREFPSFSCILVWCMTSAFPSLACNITDVTFPIQPKEVEPESKFAPLRYISAALPMLQSVVSEPNREYQRMVSAYVVAAAIVQNALYSSTTPDAKKANDKSYHLQYYTAGQMSFLELVQYAIRQSKLPSEDAVNWIDVEGVWWRHQRVHVRFWWLFRLIVQLMVHRDTGLDALCAYDPMDSAEFLTRMLLCAPMIHMKLKASFYIQDRAIPHAEMTLRCMRVLHELHVHAKHRYIDVPAISAPSMSSVLSRFRRTRAPLVLGNSESKTQSRPKTSVIVDTETLWTETDPHPYARVTRYPRTMPLARDVFVGLDEFSPRASLSRTRKLSMSRNGALVPFYEQLVELNGIISAIVAVLLHEPNAYFSWIRGDKGSDNTIDLT